MPDSKERLNILLIADNSDGVRVIRRALEASNTRCRLLMIGVGSETLAYLRQEAPYAEAPVPDLILFDVPDAKTDSIVILKRIKSDPDLRSTPIVLLTNDRSARDLDGIEIGRTRYTAFSPVDLQSFLSALNQIRPGRFMHAISLLAKFGFVLVRMPDEGPTASPAGGYKFNPRRLMHAR